MPGENSSYLTDMERDLVYFIEKFHSMSGITPDTSAMIDYLQSVGYSCRENDIDAAKNNPLFVKSMDARGIILDDKVKAKGLTPRQMVAAAAMMNVTDRRSDEKKLRDLGISNTEWQTWMQDNKFAAYMAGRAELLLGHSVHEAHLGLIRGVRQGNVPAIKLFYEITDRYNPDKDNQVDIRRVLGRVVEIIQKHVKDPAMLTSMAQDMQQLAVEVMPIGNSHTTIKGRAIEG